MEIIYTHRLILFMQLLRESRKTVELVVRSKNAHSLAFLLVVRVFGELLRAMRQSGQQGLGVNCHAFAIVAQQSYQCIRRSKR